MNPLSPFSHDDIEQAQCIGLSKTDLENQLKTLKKGLIPARANRPCILEDGIHLFTEKQQQEFLNKFENGRKSGRFSKMVPASGAATRMFQFVFNALNQPDSINLDFQEMSENLKKFPFYSKLKEVTKPIAPEALPPEKLAHSLLHTLQFAVLPKAFIPFHAYANYVSTAIDEHFMDSTLFLGNDKSEIKLHFTIDPQFVPALQEKINQHADSKHFSFKVTYSVQKPSTQTLAMTASGEPARTAEGQLLFRPGGHGSLLENLKDLNGDLVFIQNIDNVGREEHQPERVSYKKMLGGYLLFIEEKVFSFLNELETGQADLEEIWDFARKNLGIQADPDQIEPTRNEQIGQLRRILDRPLRVCGMVKNEGEPGGGPFWVTGDFQTCQILEKAQLDLSDPEQVRILNSSTHFNPVDLVCSLKNRQGLAFDLDQFTDPSTCFISTKSYNGNTIYALEHPGLWNGAMANWNTAFVEVPLCTFTPVKTVNDLLRPVHQPK